jgi:hypothetical protein
MRSYRDDTSFLNIYIAMQSLVNSITIVLEKKTMSIIKAAAQCIFIHIASTIVVDHLITSSASQYPTSVQLFLSATLTLHPPP